MSEFKIKVNVELDADDLKSKLEKLGGDNEIDLKINTNKIEEQLKGLKKSFKDTFKLDGQVINDLNKISKALSNFNKGTANGINKPLEKTKKEVTNLTKEYKSLEDAYSKLQKQMNSGKLGEDSIKRTAMQMSELKTKMGQLFDKMDSRSKEQIRLFDESKTNKQMVEMNSLMNKIETQATSLMTKINGISFDNIDSSKLKKIKNEIEEIQSVAREDIDLDLNTGELLGDLNKLQSEIKNLEKVEGLYQEFNKISDAIREAGGDTENFTNELRQL